MRVVGILLIAIVSLSRVSASTPQELAEFFAQEFQGRGVPVVNHDTAHLAPLPWIDLDADESRRDLEYRRAMLPRKYQDAGEYILLPRYKVLIPLNNVSEQDRAAMAQGKPIDPQPYLQQGAVWHRGTKPQDGDGNFSIAAHSSDEKDAEGDFKSAFQSLLLLEDGDQMIYYLRYPTAGYKRFDYRITRTKIANPQETSWLADTKDQGKLLTAYACYPLGSNEQRFVVQAVLEQEVDVVQHASAPDTPTSYIKPPLDDYRGSEEVKEEKNMPLTLSPESLTPQAREVLIRFAVLVQQQEEKIIRGRLYLGPKPVSWRKDLLIKIIEAYA